MALDNQKAEETTYFTEQSRTNGDVVLRSYKKKWLVVLVLFILTFSSAMSQMAFGPVAYTSAEFYQTEVAVINTLIIVNMAVGVASGIATTWMMHKLGLRYSLISASWLHLLGSVLRAFSAIDNLSSTEKLALVFAGQVPSAIAQPCFKFAASKVAAVWFPENQRVTANTVISISGTLGLFSAFLSFPLLVETPNDIPTMLIVNAMPAVLGALLSVIVIRSDKPPLPPSLSALKPPEPFWSGIKQLATNRQYWILLITIGGGLGICGALGIFLEQILCPWGYSDFFSGVVCGSSLVLAGVVGALLVGRYVDRNKRFSLVSKITITCCVCSFAFFVIVQNRPNLEALVALSIGLFGFFAMPLLPLGNELVVETTFPIEPATSTGLLSLSGQLQGAILIFTSQQLTRPIAPQFQNITRCQFSHNDTMEEVVHKAVIQDMTVPCYFLVGYGVFVCLVYVIFFRSANRRINMERNSAQRNVAKIEVSKASSVETPNHEYHLGEKQSSETDSAIEREPSFPNR